MFSPSLRKLWHQHWIALLNSRTAIGCAIVGSIILLVSVLQLGDSLLEWSTAIQAYRKSADNIAGRSFEDELSYSAPIDAVYTWVNGSDPEHQQALEEFRKSLAQSSQANKDEQNEGMTGFRCTSIHCVQANAVWITPRISPADLTEVFEAYSNYTERIFGPIVRYEVGNSTLALIPEAKPEVAFRLDALLADRVLDVNDHKLEFRSAHLTVRTLDVKNPHCVDVEFVKMVLNIPATLISVAENTEKIRETIQESVRTKVNMVTLYKAQNIAVIYFKDTKDDDGELKDFRALSVGEYVMDVAEVCLLADAHPSSSGNEIRLSRFKDNEELRYSLRSLQQYAGWVRRVFIVTNGQIPYWLDLSNPKMRIVSHEEIFRNKSHLPTFSSSAIESHLHHIPGLSDKFLYLNDDVLLTGKVLPEDFFSHSEGYKVHLAWHVPSCAEGCPASWINDGFCDATCNNAQCNLDGGDCANKTSGFDMDDEEDDFRLRNSLPSGTCHPGCLNGWLADRYCDTVCNHAQCAFDAGDCGLDKLAKYPHFLVDKQATMPVYKVPPGERVAVFNTSTIFADRNGTLKEGVFKQAKGIRVVAVHPQRQAIVLLLHPNTTGSSLFTITFAVPEEKTIGYEFKVEFDSSETQDEVTDQETSTFSRTLQTFATVPSELKRPKPRFDVVSKEEVRLAWSKSSLALDDLQRLKVAGQLTEYGFERRRAALLGLPVNTSITVITRTRNTEVITAPITTVSPTSTGMKKIKDEITRRNNQKNKVTTRKMSAHQYKDAYADSLRHVNRLYNDVFGIEARKVPAHVPHLVDKSVMEELQRKLPAEFDKTSATRVRSASDMQFAFSYFYYMMSVKQDVAMGQIFDEMDTDKSATWDEREVYLAALRSMGESDVDSEKQSKRLRQAVINCTSQPLSQKRLAISKKEIMACDKVKEIMLPTWNSRKKFRFKTNAESTEFTFVRVSNNLTMLHKELEGILRKPKKYICINDEVDYTREDADVIQSTTRQFFQLLFPRPSSFELPPNRRNNFRYISEFRQWEKTSGMYRRLLIIGFVLALLTFFWFIFPQRRRKMCRKVRQWVAAPRHHVDFAQRFVIDA